MVYLSGVALVLHATKHMISPKTLKRINVVLGFVLVGLGIAFLVKGLRALLPW
jgi:small neutral amino acid transporter SnatA (MarC family)